MSSLKGTATIRVEGQRVNGPREVSMARRRYQKGSLVPNRGIPANGLWVGRWREDVIQPDGTITRPYKWEVLGTIHDHPTRKLALRALEARLSTSLLADLATKCAGSAVCNENGHAMGSQLGKETKVPSVADQAWHPEVRRPCVSAWQRHIVGPDRRSDGSQARSPRARRSTDNDGVHARCHGR